MSQGPKSFAMIGKELDEATFEDALEKDYECELHWFEANKKVGIEWTPTREIAMNLLRCRYANLDRLATKVRRMCWCIGIEALAILVLIALHLIR